VNPHEIENAIEHAINALALAKLALSKSALPMFSDSDVLRKGDGIVYVEPKDDPAQRSLDMLADAERRITTLESAAVAEASAKARAAATREASR
jgi:hypothetical protein